MKDKQNDVPKLSILELDLLKWVLYKEYQEKCPYPKACDCRTLLEWHRKCNYEISRLFTNLSHDPEEARKLIKKYNK